MAAGGTKVALHVPGGPAIYDTTTPTATLVANAQSRGYEQSSHVSMNDHAALCALGEWGMQTVSY